MEETEQNDQNDSGDYTRFGIPDVPKTTVTTLFGKTKTFAGLTTKEKLFLLLSFLSIGAAIGLTIYSLVHVVETENTHSPDFTFTILILVNAGFVAFYVIHGVIRERTYELYVQIIAILVILVYCIVEYSTNSGKRTSVKLGRLIIACVFAPPNIILSILVARDFGELEFRIAGASGHLQAIYNRAAIFSCLLKFDLQVTISLVIVVLNNGTNISDLEIVTLSVGIPYTLLWCVGGWIMLRQELKYGAIAFALFGLAKPAYYIFKFVKVYKQLDDENNKMFVYIILFCGALASLVWLILMLELIQVVRNFGQGLKDRGIGSFWNLNLRVKDCVRPT